MKGAFELKPSNLLDCLDSNPILIEPPSEHGLAPGILPRGVKPDDPVMTERRGHDGRSLLLIPPPGNGVNRVLATTTGPPRYGTLYTS